MKRRRLRVDVKYIFWQYSRVFSETCVKANCAGFENCIKVEYTYRFAVFKTILGADDRCVLIVPLVIVEKGRQVA